MYTRRWISVDNVVVGFKEGLGDVGFMKDPHTFTLKVQKGVEKHILY